MKPGVEFGQRLCAESFWIQLQRLRQAREFIKFYSPPPVLPEPDAFWCDLECVGDFRLDEVEFFPAPAQYEV